MTLALKNSPVYVGDMPTDGKGIYPALDIPLVNKVTLTPRASLI